MSKIVLNDKIFHAISPYVGWNPDYIYDEEFYKRTSIILEQIFLAKTIKCRQSLFDDEIEKHYFSCRNFNGRDTVSFSKHISKLQEDKKAKGYIINEDEENAWTDYPFNYPAFVFSEKLVYKNPESNQARIPLEIQLEGDIDLVDSVAISFPVFSHIIEPFFVGKHNLEEDFDCLNSNKVIYKKDILRYKILRRILELKELYNIKIPIISVTTGEKYHKNDKFEEKIKRFNL